MRRPFFFAFLIAITAIHLLLLFYDASHADLFLHTDRAYQRWGNFKILDNMTNNTEWTTFLTENGNPGDYFVQWLLFHYLGRLGLITVQIGLSVFSGYVVYRLVHLLGLSEGTAILSACIYLISPHTFVFAHQLASESIYCPLFLMSLYLSIVAFKHEKTYIAGLSAILIGLANLIRPLTLLWPLAIAGLFIYYRKPKHAAIYGSISLLPVLAWMGFMAISTGQFGMGESSRDLGHNLYQRILLISDALPPEQSAEIEQRYLKYGKVAQGLIGKTSVFEYLDFVSHYPMPFLKHSATELSVFLTKSGIERYSIDYFPLIEESTRDSLQKNRVGWRFKLQNEGLIATLNFLWETQGLALVISILGLGWMAIISGLAIFGEIQLFKRLKQDLSLSPVQHFMTLLLMALPVYIYGLSSAVDAMQSRHRAPAEAAIIIFAVHGFFILLSKYRAKQILTTN